MSKQVPYTEVNVGKMEKFMEDPEFGQQKNPYPNVKPNPLTSGNAFSEKYYNSHLRGAFGFWGQLGLMALLTFLFWLCLFVIAGSPLPGTFDKKIAPCSPIFNEQAALGSENSNSVQDSQPATPVLTQTGFFFAAFFTTTGENLTLLDPFQNPEDLLLENDLVDNPSSQYNKSESEKAVESDIETAVGDVDETLNLLQEQASAISEIFRLINPDVETPKYIVGPKDLKLNWFEALQACLFQKMQLVSIESEEKSQEVEKVIQESLASPEDDDDFWTSGTNMWSYDRSKFYWASTGELVNFTRWHSNNPSSQLGITDQNCIELTKSLAAKTRGQYRWNDYGCHSKSRFICEKL